MKRADLKIPSLVDSDEFEKYQRREKWIEIRMTHNKLAENRIARNIRLIMEGQYPYRRYLFKNNEYIEMGKDVAELVHVDEECAKLYAVCIHYLRCRSFSLLSIDTLYKLLQTPDPDKPNDREIIDILFSKEGLCHSDVISEYRELRDNCPNFNQLCKRARDALYPYISLSDDELSNYSLT